METTEKKKECRKNALTRRRELSADWRNEADQKRNGWIFKSERYHDAELVLLYINIRDEASTEAILEKALEDGKTVAAPKVSGDAMEFFRIRSAKELQIGAFHIPEPKDDALLINPDEYEKEKVLFLIPGAAFDAEGGRIGYGGGFYDRYFQKHPGLVKTALAFSTQMVPLVPRMEYDSRVDEIFTEDGRIEARPDLERLLAGERAQKAMALFKEGYNCSQSIILAFADFYQEKAKEYSRMSSSFGGGMSRLRQVCGSVSGMFLVSGLLYGYDGPETGAVKAEHYARNQYLAAEFERIHGSIVCRELLHLSEKKSVPVPEQRTAEYYQKRPCGQIIGSAAAILEEYIKNHPLTLAISEK